MPAWCCLSQRQMPRTHALLQISANVSSRNHTSSRPNRLCCLSRRKQSYVNFKSSWRQRKTFIRRLSLCQLRTKSVFSRWNRPWHSLKRYATGNGGGCIRGFRRTVESPHIHHGYRCDPCQRTHYSHWRLHLFWQRKAAFTFRRHLPHHWTIRHKHQHTRAYQPKRGWEPAFNAVCCGMVGKPAQQGMQGMLPTAEKQRKVRKTGHDSCGGQTYSTGIPVVTSNSSYIDGYISTKPNADIWQILISLWRKMDEWRGRNWT